MACRISWCSGTGFGSGCKAPAAAAAAARTAEDEAAKSCRNRTGSSRGGSCRSGAATGELANQGVRTGFRMLLAHMARAQTVSFVVVGTCGSRAAVLPACFLHAMAAALTQCMQPNDACCSSIRQLLQHDTQLHTVFTACRLCLPSCRGLLPATQPLDLHPSAVSMFFDSCSCR